MVVVAMSEEAIRAGAHVFVDQMILGAEEAFYKYATDAQLDFVAPHRKLVAETFDASLRVWSDENTRSLAAVDPTRIARNRKAWADIFNGVMKRIAEGKYRWCVTLHPTPAMAQEANMSLADYTDFVYGAGMLHEFDPVGFWRGEGKKQEALIAWLHGRKQVVLKGSNIDLKLSIEGRTSDKSDGLYNFPDGEICTSPVDDSANGWVRFRYPGIFNGQEVEDIELWFEEGRVVKEKAARNQHLLTSLLDLVVLDEAYIEFAGQDLGASLSRIQDVLLHENLVVLRTFSKWAGLAGLRIGYGPFPLWLMPTLWKSKQPYNVNVAASVAAQVSLTHVDELKEVVERLNTERARLFSELQDIPYLEPYPTQSNFILCRVTGPEAAVLKSRLAQEYGVFIRYFDKPGLRDHIRISVGRPQDTD